MPLGTALRWAAQKCINLREEGFGEAVLDAVQPLYSQYARTGDESLMAQAHRLLLGEVK